MGRPKLTAQETESARAEILAAAEALFAEHGFEAVSLRSIAKHIGCSPMRPYKYFANKAEIFDAVRCEAHKRFYARQEVAIAGIDDPLTRIRRLGQAYSTYAAEFPHAYRMMFQLGQPVTQSEETKAAEQQMFQLLVQANVDAVAQQQLRGDPVTLAHLFWTTMHGTIALDLAGKLVYGKSRDELLTALTLGEFTGAKVQPPV